MGDANNALLSLYPALVECFTIILLGYIAGRARWITSTQAEGLNAFTGLYALPALLFCNLATLDWSKVEWTFLGAMLVSKAVLFFAVLLTGLVLQHPCNVGAAGLYAVFTTQSNDFALGYPIIDAIYSTSHPEFVQYIYLLAPISLLILNPIAFVLLEIQKASSREGNIILRVLKQICTNPIIIASILGFAANFIFSGTLPLVLDELLTVLSQAFSAPALFMLGISAVGKFSKSTPSLLVGSGLLICAKLLVLPMIAMGMTVAFRCGQETNSTADYSMFAFLYGTIPTAPTVFIYATRYGVAVDLIATSLVVATVISAPLMFISATVVGIQILSVQDGLMSDISVDISIVAIIFSVCVLLLFAVTKRGCRIPHLMIVILVIYQVFVSVGVLVNWSAGAQDCSLGPLWYDYVVYIIHTLGTLGVPAMVFVTAVTIYLISCYNYSKAVRMQRWLLFYGLGSPIILTSVSILTDNVERRRCTGLSMFGNPQLIIVLCALIINTVLTIAVLILRHRRIAHPLPPTTPTTSDHHDESTQCITSAISSTRLYGACDDIDTEENKNLLPPIENIPVPSASSAGDTDEAVRNSESCSVEGCGIQDIDSASGSSQSSYVMFGRILVLLVVLIICQITILFYYMGLLIKFCRGQFEGSVAVEFLYTVAHTGQGFFTFLIFGLDSQFVLAPIKRAVRKIINTVRGNEREETILSDENLRICQQFSQHHLQHCLESLPRLHRSKNDCFHGVALTCWLTDAGLVADSADAEAYAGNLLQGGIIQSCSQRNTDIFINSKRNIYRFGEPKNFHFSVENA